MTAASCSDALRLVLAQKLLKKEKMGSFEGLTCISPMCLLFMMPVAVFKVRWAGHGGLIRVVRSSLLTYLYRDISAALLCSHSVQIAPVRPRLTHFISSAPRARQPPHPARLPPARARLV
jgi:hypothetical protein